tara:strand:+ start:475 stop:1272 length:798 start_codon:yes stop_codon:yes gene_type:complete
MIVHNLDPVLIDLGFFQIRWYSIAYILGIILGWLYASIIIKNYNDIININKADFEDLIIYLVAGIIFGGRLGYVIFYDPIYFIQNFSEIFKIWNGGMSFHGGVLGVIIATFIFTKISKNSFFKFTDIIACVAPIGLFLGRIANFINAELFGKATTVPWAVIFPNVDNLARHPSQIYEAILEGVFLFLIINFLAIKNKLLLKPGYISGFFLIFYSIARIVSENFREADAHLGYFFNYFSMGTMLSALTFLSGCCIVFYIKNNEQNN